jgi:CSLREA domain-containing protein
MNLSKLVAVAGILGLTVANSAPPIWANAPMTFVVNSTLDKPDGVLADGKCTTFDNPEECTLRAAIMAANYLTGATVQVPAGIYTLTLPPVHPWYVPGWFGHLEATTSMTITGAGPGETIIDGNRNVIGEAVLVISGTSVISGVTIQNGAGGVIGQGDVHIVNSVITGNVTRFTQGANILWQYLGPGVRGRAITLTNSIVSNNLVEPIGYDFPNISSMACGGGVAGKVTLIESAVINNVVSATFASGGGVCGDDALIYNSVISGNVGSGFSGSGVIIDSVIANNTRFGDGGGVFFQQPDAMQGNTPLGLTIQNTLIHGNVARGSQSDGGGVYAASGWCYSGRAGLWCPEPIRLINSTITGNRADNDGGGIMAIGITSNHVTIAANSADADIDGQGTAGGFMSLNHSRVGPTSLNGALIAGNAPDQVGGSFAALVEPNLITDTLSVVSPLSDNGGPTPTHALPPDSPAINAGNPACVATDQRGIFRPYGGRCDLGAVEMQIGAPPQIVFLPSLWR